jgi:hypothetical protein
VRQGLFRKRLTTEYLAIGLLALLSLLLAQISNLQSGLRDGDEERG